MSGPEPPGEDEKKTGARATSGLARFVGMASLAIAVLIRGVAAFVVFLPFSGAQRARTTSALLVDGLFRRCRGFLDPWRLLGGKGR